ncbi:MAG TPA: hypothetical protein VK943_19365, partial [Arenibaculum sp.]|nr:hypothetical protein [Arenibaculum sp.]
MNSHARRRQAAAVVKEVRTAFNEVVLPRILADRIDRLSETDTKEIRAGRRIDTRLPRFLSVSGKGGPGHEDYTNVTLFDHVTSVGMAAATLASLDLLASELDLDVVRRCAAVALAVGLLHDADKLLGVDWRAVDDAEVERLLELYGLDVFLARFGVELNGGQIATLIAYTEIRAAHHSSGVRVSDTDVQVVRRYVRLADTLDGFWLS